MSGRGKFEVTYKSAAETGGVIAFAVQSAITAQDPGYGLSILRRLVASMPSSLRERVYAKARDYVEEYRKRYRSEVESYYKKALDSTSDLNIRARLMAERGEALARADMEAELEAILSALGDVGGESGFWFGMRRQALPPWMREG